VKIEETSNLILEGDFTTRKQLLTVNVKEQLLGLTHFLYTKSFIHRAYCVVNNITSPPTCPICDKLLIFAYRSGKLTIKKYCSTKCREQATTTKKENAPICKMCDNTVGFDSTTLPKQICHQLSCSWWIQ
jgi:hypothetical protein